MKWFFARSKYNCLLLSFLFVFVSPAERYSLENFGSPWCAVAVGFQTFQEKKIDKKYDDAKWMLTITWVAHECRHKAEPVRLCHGTLADEHIYQGDKRVHESGVLGIEVP
jgi:hypothetical protein